MAFEILPSGRLPHALASAARRFLQIDQLERLYEKARERPGFTRGLLDELDVQISLAPADLEKIPTSGAVVALANHPYGILDGIVLAELLTHIRPDVRILTNQMLSSLPELARICFFINPFDRPECRAANGRALRQSVAHLRAGGMLLIFPAGEVAHFDIRKGAIRDPEWSETAVRLIRMTNARALPILISGKNGLPFQMVGMVHPRLRTAALPAELLNKRGKIVEVRVGNAIAMQRVAATVSDKDATQYLRLRTELLAQRSDEPVISEGTWEEPVVEPAAAVGADEIASEIARLPASTLLEETREFEVRIAEAQQIPRVLQEIGRLREVTFRAAGEGTGAAIDLDRFDEHYLHLFLWNREKREIVGAYRIGDVPALLALLGRRGLYTNSLFRFSPRFFANLGPALELGRSFVRPEYQRQFSPLLLLWKGIGAYVARRPQYAKLIGAVSVSNRYSTASRELIARYFETRNSSGMPQGSVKARHPLRGSLVRRWEMNSLCSLLPDVDELSAPITDLEPDGKGIPILVKQYVRMGGQLLAFSVDPQFANTLDGFVLVDLTRTSPEALARYMGKEQTAKFFAWHHANSIRVA
jgi:putative hemolysin